MKLREVLIDRSELIQIRHQLDKSQVQLARLMGVSVKAIQSFEQGWRNVPAQVERQLLFLLYLKKLPEQGTAHCWEKKNCSPQWREKCAAWEFRDGRLCWFINGTICEGKVHERWDMKMLLCRQCEVFRALFTSLE